MVISTPFPPEDGIGYHVYNLSKCLIERGHNVTVITRGSLNKTQTSNFDGIQIIKIFFIPIYPLHVHIHRLFLNKVFRSIENEFDVVHIHTPLTPVVKTSLPIVSTIHTSITEDARHIETTNFTSIKVKFQTKYLSFPLINKLAKNSTLNTTVSNSVVQELKNDYCLDGVQVVSNGVDHKKLYPINKNEIGNYILYVGRLSYRKGLFTLIDAIKHISEDYNVKLLIVGKGEFESIVKKKVKEDNLENRVHFLGHVDRKKLISLYQHAKIFIMPSLYESGPLTVLEAMSCGRPVVATSVGIVPEVITNLKNGIIIRPSSTKDIIESINLLLDDDELRNELGTNARITVERRYTWDIVTDNVEKCYEFAISKNKF